MTRNGGALGSDAEVLYEHPMIHTGDPETPRATAIVARGEWVVAVGDRPALRDAFPHGRSMC